MASSPTPTVVKTIKLFLGGAFPRSESGRSFALHHQDSDAVYAQVCRASRKDLRNAIGFAQKAQPAWQARTAFNRGQILYRMAEMLEGKRDEVVQVLKQTSAQKAKDARGEVDGAIAAFVYHAGFADKYQAVMGSLNPVSGPHHCFSAVEPVGVVFLSNDPKSQLAQLCAHIAAIIVSGNALVTLLPEKLSALLAPLGETFATSDLPAGVINLLSGHEEELFPHMASHMEIHSVSFQNQNDKRRAELQRAAAAHMKRVVPYTSNPLSLKYLTQFTEVKTVWHPAGL